MPSLKCARDDDPFMIFHNAERDIHSQQCYEVNYTRDDVGKKLITQSLRRSFIVMAINETRLKVKFERKAFNFLTIFINFHFQSLFPAAQN